MRISKACPTIRPWNARWRNCGSTPNGCGCLAPIRRRACGPRRTRAASAALRPPPQQGVGDGIGRSRAELAGTGKRIPHLLAACPERVFQLLRVEVQRSEEHTSELQSLMRISYAVFCLKKKKKYT